MKPTESGKVDALNVGAGGRLVKMRGAPYKDPQDTIKFLEPMETDVVIVNGGLADGEDPVSRVIVVQLMESREMVLAIYGEVKPTFEASGSSTARAFDHVYWYEKIQVCYWLPGVGKHSRGIQHKVLVLVSGAMLKKKVHFPPWILFPQAKYKIRHVLHHLPL